MIHNPIRWSCLLAALALAASGCNGDGGTTVPGPTTGSVSGRVTEGSNNVASAQVALSGSVTRNATTDASGAFGFADLAPGSYSLTLTPPQGFRLRSGDSQTKPATVVAGQTATVDWDLDRDSGSQVEEIRITGFQFGRPDITIAPGTTVRWINDSGMFHTITPENASQAGVWQRVATDAAGVILEHTFNVSGQTYRYRCEPHSSSFTEGMVGVIRVQ